jgi:hypothetical protein
VLFFLMACPGSEPTPVDLTQRLDAGEARAGVIVDAASLFGGVSAEGQLGDFKLYNDRVQFIVQGPREGHYYIAQAGGVVDADIVRAEGAQGRDLVDDWITMMSVGRVAYATGFAVLDDGRDSGSAHLRVWGHEAPFELVTGAVGDPGFVPDLGLDFVTDYVLPADSWVMEVTTTFTATDGDASFTPGDMLQASLDASNSWTPGTGLGSAELGSFPWLGFSGQRGDGAVALLAADGGELRVDSGAALVSSLAEMVVGAGDFTELDEGESTTWTRLYGVAPDLAKLAEAHAPGQELSGTSIPGAEVAIFADGEPWTLAKADDSGAWTGHAPSGATVETVEMGIGHPIFVDRPDGWGSYSGYAEASVLEGSLASLTEGGIPSFTEARGWGVGELTEPATLTVSVADGGPFEVQVAFQGAAPAVDGRISAGWPGGLAAMAWAVDGEVTVQVPEGNYDVLVHRGARYEVFEQSVLLTSGGSQTVDAELEQAYEHVGWLAADPHAHAAPSGDGSCTMEDRITVMAARGIQLHFGTDHDHVSDYRPIVSALGLEPHMASVVASEVSPVLRGHQNIYPLTPDPSLPSGSQYLWYRELVDTTQDMVDILRDRYPGVLIQMNHPLDSGVGAAAGWEPGSIGKPDFWSPDYDAVEVINDNNREYFDFYLDLVNHGVLPMGVSVSDTHGCTSGDPGVHITFLHMSEDPLDYTDEALRSAYNDRTAVASMGPFIELSQLPGSTLTSATTLSAEAFSPSWIVVDELALMENGIEVEVQEGTTAEFTLDPDSDASYIVIARGSQNMAPVWPRLQPWAMTNAILFDVGGDGWTAPSGSF